MPPPHPHLPPPTVASRRPAYQNRVAAMAGAFTEPELSFGAPSERVGQARRVLANVYGASSKDAEHSYVDEALALDPGNPDALRLRADREEHPAKRLVRVDEAVAAGLSRAGALAFAAALTQRAWDLVAARPWLRARGRRLEVLVELGRDAEAVEEGEALLELEPADPIGTRYRLVGAYLFLGKTAAYRRLRQRYATDHAAFFQWGDVLAAIHAGDDDVAREALHVATRRQPGLGALLLSPWTMPRAVPLVWMPDTKSERLAVAHELYPAWSAHPTALAWLASHTATAKPRSARMRNLLESLRPGTDMGPEPRWLEWALRGQGKASETLVRAARRDGERGAAWLVELMRRDDLDVKGAPGKGYAPTTAAAVLGELASPSSLAAQVEALPKAQPRSLLNYAIRSSFRFHGAGALEPLLAVLASHDTTEPHELLHWDATLAALVTLDVPDERVFDAVAVLFQRDPAAAAPFFTRLGSQKALPLLAAWMEAQQVGLSETPDALLRQFNAVVVAAQALGGDIPARLESKLTRLLAIRDDQVTRAAHVCPVHGAADAAGGGDGYDHDPQHEHEAAADDEDGEPSDLTDDHARPGPPAALPPKPPNPFGPPRPPLPYHRPPAAGVSAAKVGRNDPCPCGSGKKYKKCCWDAHHGG